MTLFAAIVFLSSLALAVLVLLAVAWLWLRDKRASWRRSGRLDRWRHRGGANGRYVSISGRSRSVSSVDGSRFWGRKLEHDGRAQ